MSKTTSQSPRLRLQFSLATLFGLMTLAAIGTWYWYQRPFEIEKKVADPSDPFGATGTATSHREVDTVRRLWGGKTMLHGPRRVYDAKGTLIRLENYGGGQKHGQFITYTSQGAKSSEQAFDRGKRHGPSLRWNSKGVLTFEENYANDVRHGKLLVQHADGSLAIEASYEKGDPAGEWSWFPTAKSADGNQGSGSIAGQWHNALPYGRWEWRDAGQNVYLAADFQNGRISSSEALAVHPQALESVVYAAANNPQLMPFLFRPITLEFTDLPLKEVLLKCTAATRVPIRFDFNALAEACLSVDLPINERITDLPLIIGISKILRNYSMDCDFRYGMLCVVPARSLENWEDATGVTQLVPPPGSHLSDELMRTTTIDVVEMPLKDVALYLQEVHRVRFDISLMPAVSKPGSSIPTADSPITASLRGITFKDALATIVDQLRCKASLRGETIVIEPQ